MKRINLINFRKELGLTQEEVADKLGCSRVHYVNLELGLHNGSIDFWYKFQEVFGAENYDMWNLISKEEK